MMRFKRFFPLILILCSLSALAQRDNTIYVVQFPGKTVGEKLTLAQTKGCNPDTNIPCVLILDPTLAAFPLGTLPAKCANCTWKDYSGKAGGEQFNAFTVSATAQSQNVLTVINDLGNTVGLWMPNSSDWQNTLKLFAPYPDARTKIEWWENPAFSATNARPLSIETHGLNGNPGTGTHENHVTFYSESDVAEAYQHALEWHWGAEWDGMMYIGKGADSTQGLGGYGMSLNVGGVVTSSHYLQLAEPSNGRLGNVAMALMQGPADTGNSNTSALFSNGLWYDRAGQFWRKDVGATVSTTGDNYFGALGFDWNSAFWLAVAGTDNTGDRKLTHAQLAPFKRLLVDSSGNFIFQNLSDASAYLKINSGSTAAQNSALLFTDRGTTYFSLSKDTTNNLRLLDSQNSSFNRLVIAPGAGSELNSYGTSGVSINTRTNAGTGGTNFGSGGASPTTVATISSAGKGTFNGGVQVTSTTGPTWTSAAGVPSGSCTVGSLYSNTSGGATTTLYVCTATNTWTAK